MSKSKTETRQAALTIRTAPIDGITCVVLEARDYPTVLTISEAKTLAEQMNIAANRARFGTIGTVAEIGKAK